jgi:NAD(P)-dependent dehydrogenase (short-subunit alcohol dehydrogenase family)
MFDLVAVQSETEVTRMRRVAVITGASRGIGAATAVVLAERGFRVIVNHRASASQAEEVVAAIRAAGGEAVAIQADVTAPGEVARMVGEIEQRWEAWTCSFTMRCCLLPSPRSPS